MSEKLPLTQAEEILKKHYEEASGKEFDKDMLDSLKYAKYAMLEYSEQSMESTIDAYEKDRNELIKALEIVRGNCLISGDFHLGPPISPGVNFVIGTLNSATNDEIREEANNHIEERRKFIAGE